MKDNFIRWTRWLVRQAQYLARHLEEIKLLLAHATTRAEGLRGHGDLKRMVLLAVRFVRAVADGTYRPIPWHLVIALTTCLLYFLLPLDAVPDLLPFGFMDDAVLLSWVLGTFKTDLRAFEAWERNRDRDGPA